ncbi:MAG: hypothetical protein R6W06_02945 [Prochlorococcaceae cyanobacterium]
MPEQEEQRYRLAIAGSDWPAELDTLGRPLASLKAARKKLERFNEAEVWIGYGSPLSLLASAATDDPRDALERWAKQASRALELRQAHPGRCSLINLSLLNQQAISQLLQADEAEPALESKTGSIAASTPTSAPSSATGPIKPASSDPAPSTELDLRLALALQHRRDLSDLYADLEGCCELLGREPQFQLPLPPLRGAALAERCLESWSIQQAEHQQFLALQAEQAASAETALKEAREEAELTLLQLHQVQEELEHYFLENRKASEEREALEQRASNAEAALQKAQAETETLSQQLQALQAQQAEQGASAETALKEAREEAELTLLQLHQVQEELEHYFLENRKASEETNALQGKLETLEQEALHLFLHATPNADLDHSRLEQLTALARAALQLN